MGNINLLPRKKSSERYFLLWLILIALGFAISITLQMIVANLGNNAINRAEEEIAFVEARMAAQNEKFVQDARTTKYKRIMKQIEQLQSEKKDWLKDLVYIIADIPENTKIEYMNVDDEFLLQSEMHFDTLEAYMAYSEKLKSAPNIESLVVFEIAKVVPDPIEDVKDGNGNRPDLTLPERIDSGKRLSYLLPDDVDYRDIGSELLDVFDQAELATEDEHDLSPYLNEESPFSLDDLLSQLGSIGEEDEEEVVDIVEKEFYRIILRIQLMPPHSQEGAR